MKIPDPSPFGQRLRATRHAAGLTQDELAQAAGLRRQTISHLERGYIQDLSGSNVAALAVRLGVTADWLLGIAADSEKECPRKE